MYIFRLILFKEKNLFFLCSFFPSLKNLPTRFQTWINNVNFFMVWGCQEQSSTDLKQLAKSCCITNLVTFVIEKPCGWYPLKSLETEFAPSNLNISLFNNNYTVNKKPSTSLTRPMEMNMIIKVLPKYVIADMSPNPTVLIVTCQLKTAPVRITIIITMRPTINLSPVTSY